MALDISESIFVTTPDVPLAETGIEYPVSTGLVTFTEADLQDMVESQDDPAIVSPRLKIGHTDPRFIGEVLDGEPAFGIAQNLRLTNNNQTVICDFTGVPKWLADILPSAYPNRSIEGNWDVETVTGHKWRFVCSAVALLGVVWPGISTLDDLQAAFSEQGPEGVEVVTPVAATASKTLTSDELMPRLLGTALKASINLEDVRRSFYDDFATQESGRIWWWVRAVMLNPDELIVDDDEGGLFRVPFSESGGTVTFDDPIPVKIEYVDAPVAASSGRAPVLASTYANSQASRPADRQEEQVEASTSAIDLASLRQNLGLAEDATEDQINEELNRRNQASEESPEIDGEGSSEGDSGPDDGESSPTTTASVAEDGTIRIDRATLDQLNHDASLGRQAFERQRVADRDAFLSAAVKAGKFPPARKDHWAKAWDHDPEGIKAAINEMPEGLIPVTQLGGAPLEETGDAGPLYPASWLPELHQEPHDTITQEA